MKNLRNIATVFLFVLCFCTGVFSQNLCPNPGFEQLSGCPSGPGEITKATPWQDAGNPSDLFSFCHVNGPVPGCNDVNVPENFAGISGAHGGSSYAGFYTRRQATNQRTYIQAPIPTLTAGELYRVIAHFKRSGFSEFATNRLGIVFSTAPLAQPGLNHIPIAPQLEETSVIADTANWTVFTGYYTATGVESNIALGNFRSDGNTQSFNFSIPAPACNSMTDCAFYYVDDLSLVLVNETLSVSGDTMICAGETTTLSGITNTTGWWSLPSSPNDTLSSVNGVLTVSPAVTTSYFWNGISETYVVTVFVTAPPVVQLPPDTSFCEGSSLLLNAGNAGSTFLWSDGSTAQQLTVTESGIYIVTVDNGSCKARDTFYSSVLPAPEPTLQGPFTLCPDNGETVLLDAGPGLTYTWIPGGDTTRTLLVSVPGIYSVVIAHGSGCTRSAEVRVTELCRETLFIPGAFTPNQDGKNDLFFAEGTNLLSFEIVIFNRWGQEVFTSKVIGQQGAWDGKLNGTEATVGLYAYHVKYEALKENGKKKTEMKTGTFVLVR